MNHTSGMESLQAVLMQSIESVMKGDMDTSKARAVNEFAQTLINSAKVEVEFLRATKKTKSVFFGQKTEDVTRLTNSGNVVKQVANGPWRGLVHTTADDTND